MEKLTRYHVVREHEGDRFYAAGETRDGLASELGHLVPRVLEPLGPVPEAKTEPAPANKAEGAAPANKASGRKAKTKG
jgi:hypothetical protein